MPSSKPDAKPEREYALWIVVNDIHIPEDHKPSVAAVEQYMADEWLDGWACLGDLLDNDAISDYNRDAPRKRVSAPTVQEQFDSANAWLDRHLAAATKRNSNCRKVLLEGNHEHRQERYADRNPELEGLVSIERGLHLKARGIEYVRFWSKGDLYRIGKLYLGHGVYTVTNHAAKHVNEYGCNLLYGHAHDIQSRYRRRRGSNHPLMAQSAGCLCRYDQLYMRGRPMDWMHAFTVVFSFTDGTFQLNVIPILNGRFVAPNGKVYRG